MECCTLLSEIHSPEDIRHLNRTELAALAADIRKIIIETVAQNGGHLASNLGVVELTLALHRVFDSPTDAIIWDVSHQCYTHKLLTGRYAAFPTLRRHGGIAGFTKRSESPHDFFDVGHSSTSISSALGLLTARELFGTEGKVVAVIGDGALTGGMAFEALSHAGAMAKNLIVVLNDNQMSIGKNTGGISKYLSRLTATLPYQSFRRTVDHIAENIPIVRRFMPHLIFRFKRGLKGLFFQTNLFSDLGFEYVGPLDGHNIAELEPVLRTAKHLSRPVVVHVLTKKGCGYSPAENDPEAFHGIGPFCISDGTVEKFDAMSYTEVFSNALVRLAARDSRVVAITAAMMKGTGLARFAHKYPDRFFDVGIAEQHAVTFAGGLAAAGAVPVAAIYSTFMQRAMDQFIHDIAIPAFPVIFMLDRAGAVPDDGETHQGVFDMVLMRSVPNVILTTPASAKELEALLFWAAKRGAPVVIRYPKTSCPSEFDAFAQPIEEGRGVLLRCNEYSDAETAELSDTDSRGSVLFVCTGGIFSEVLTACRSLAFKRITADIYNLRFIKPVDLAYFQSVAECYRYVVFAEDGMCAGGIGEYLSAYYKTIRPDGRCAAAGFPDSFIAQGKRAEVLADAGLSAAALAELACALTAD